ncbi:hypothetical protein AAC387_Pa03g2227 [Persea americana]
MAWVLCTPFSRPAVCTPATKTEHCRNHQQPKGLPLNRVSSQIAARPDTLRQTSKLSSEVGMPLNFH